MGEYACPVYEYMSLVINLARKFSIKSQKIGIFQKLSIQSQFPPLWILAEYFWKVSSWTFLNQSWIFLKISESDLKISESHLKISESCLKTSENGVWKIAENVWILAETVPISAKIQKWAQCSGSEVFRSIQLKFRSLFSQNSAVFFHEGITIVFILSTRGCKSKNR